MCKLRVYRIFGMIVAIFAMLFIFSSEVKAAGYSGCRKQIENTSYYDCGNFAYTYHENENYSSKIYASDYTQRVVYAGEVNGYSVFYANGFRFYNVAYDDRSKNDNNIWTKIELAGRVLFNGEFEDTWVLDESHKGFINGGFVLGAGTYIITQYHNNGETLRKIIVYSVINSKSNTYKTDVSSFIYDGENISGEKTSDVLMLSNELKINMVSDFGVESISVKVNGEEINDYTFTNNQIRMSPSINNYFRIGEVNNIEINAKNYLGVSMTKVFSLNVLNNNVSISFSSISSEVISSSRRILVSAHAGIGKTLDRDYCWYYWSTNPDDALDYESFLVNYANSEYKGSYSADKGVILRNTSGTYYLYALAKDEDSTIVARSDGYTLDDGSFKVNYNVYDGILVVSLLLLATTSIAIYLFIRKRGY